MELKGKVVRSSGELACDERLEEGRYTLTLRNEG